MLSRFRVPSFNAARLARTCLGVLFVLLVASCSGSGCSGCSGCAGSTPLPGGFPPDKAVTNAASVRVSRPGLDFLEQQLPATVAKALGAPGGTLNFNIPTIDPPKTQIADIGIGKILIDPIVCAAGPDPTANPPRCVAQIGIGASQFQLDSITPSSLRLRATVPLKLDDTPVTASLRVDPFIGGEFSLGGITIHLGYGDGGCSNGRPAVTPHALPIGVTLPLVAETIPPRVGYTKIDINNAQIDLSGLNENDVRVCMNCGFASDVCSAISDSSFIKGLAISPIRDALTSNVKSLLREQLCTKPVATLNPPCPTGSKPDGGNKFCMYDAQPNSCVPMLLGTDMHVDLSGALKAYSPSTTGGLDFGLGVNGAMVPAPGLPANGAGRTPNGISLGMLGGALPQPPSKCVTQVPMTPPTGIPLPDEIVPTVVDPAGTPHVGMALSGRFLDYAFTGVYNSGLLCLGVSTEQVALLKTGLLSFLIPSLKTLTFEQRDAAAAIATRPQKPPVVKLGGGTDVNADPLLTIALPEFAIDFYVWSFDRFVRVFTYTSDLTIPANLQAGKDGLTPALGDIKVANGKVTNADLLMDNPDMVAGAVAGIFGTVSQQLVGNGFTPINVGGLLSSFGVDVQVNSISKLTKGTDEFVGVFATMAKTTSPANVEVDTTATLVSKTVHADHMTLSTVDPAKYPELAVDVGSPLDDGARKIEYAFWIDEGLHSAWSTDKHLVIKNAQLLMQGKHVLNVVARIAGEVRTEDLTPAQIPFAIDVLAPFVEIEKDNTLKTWDVVSPTDKLVARFRKAGGTFTEWQPVDRIGKLPLDVAEVEVKDEEGNVGQVRQAIRGKEDATLAGTDGCSCRVPGSPKDDPKTGLATAALLALAVGVIAFRRNRRDVAARPRAAAFALASIGAVAATSQGCACGDEGDLASSRCGADCQQECATGLGIGQPGAYLSVAKDKDGAIWAAGYNDALLTEGDALLWGDLVVGKYDASRQAFDWQTVDGIATREDGTCPSYEPNGWRRGETDSGENVGLWTSIQVTNAGVPLISYYDATNRRLKLASKDGDGWRIEVIKEQAGADIGKYSKMILKDGKPVLAFLQLEPGHNGHTRAKVVVARANVEEPRGAGDFRFEDAAVDEEGPCRPSDCGKDACVKSTGVCTPKVSGCDPNCGDGEACVTVDGKAACVDTASGIETYPRALGSYISLASGPSGLGIAAYDGYHGNLLAIAESGGGWSKTILDGETGSRPDKTAIDTGDTGIAASLFITSNGDWHVSYVNGIDETLRYISVAGGQVGRSMIIDDGTGVDGAPFADGIHIVGDDSTIRVEGDTVTVFYADSSALTLRRAIGTTAGNTRNWTLKSFPQPKRLVAFPAFIPGEPRVAAWWRESTWATRTVTGDVSILSP